MRILLAGVILVVAVACELPTTVDVRGPCVARTVNYWNLNGQLDSTVTVIDSLTCPR